MIKLDNFVKQFQCLQSSGYDASLNVESKLGEMFITLSCKVGRTVPPPTFPLAPFAVITPKTRNPSYFRRQACRKAMRDSKKELNDSFTSEAEQVMEDVDIVENSDVKPNDVSQIIVAEKTTESESSSVELTGSKDETLIQNEASVEDVAPVEDDVEEVDLDELARDRIIDDVIAYAVTKPIERTEVVEREIVQP